MAQIMSINRGLTMPIRPRHLAEEIFRPYYEILYDCVVAGLGDYPKEYSRVASKHRANTKRSIVRDHIVDRLRKNFIDTKIRVREKYGTTYFGFGGHFRMIVRKLNENQRVALNSTQLAFDIQYNDDTPPLGHLFAGTTSVYLGYFLTDDPENPDVFIVCPDGVRNAWDISILPPAKKSGEVHEFPLPPGPPSDDDLVRIPEQLPSRERNE